MVRVAVNEVEDSKPFYFFSTFLLPVVKTFRSASLAVRSNLLRWNQQNICQSPPSQIIIEMLINPSAFVVIRRCHNPQNQNWYNHYQHHLIKTQQTRSTSKPKPILRTSGRDQQNADRPLSNCRSGRSSSPLPTLPQTLAWHLQLKVWQSSCVDEKLLSENKTWWPFFIKFSMQEYRAKHIDSEHCTARRLPWFPRVRRRRPPWWEGQPQQPVSWWKWLSGHVGLIF